MLWRLPNIGEAVSLDGAPPPGLSKFALLKTLKTSQRNSKFVRSLTVKRLNLRNLNDILTNLTDIFRQFGEDTKGVAEMLSTNPSKACELFDSLEKKYEL